jgi:hypothetical protein
VIEFAQREIDDQLEQILEKEKYRSWSNALIKLFDFSKVAIAAHHWLQFLESKQSPYLTSALPIAQQVCMKTDELLEVGRKFQKQLHQVFEGVHNGGTTQQLEERMVKAVQYFSDKLAIELLEPIQLHLKQLQYATRVKKYLEEVTQLESLLWQFLQRLQNCKYGDIQFSKNINAYKKYSPEVQEKKITKTTSHIHH